MPSCAHPGPSRPRWQARWRQPASGPWHPVVGVIGGALHLFFGLGDIVRIGHSASRANSVADTASQQGLLGADCRPAKLRYPSLTSQLLWRVNKRHCHGPALLYPDEMLRSNFATNSPIQRALN